MLPQWFGVKLQGPRSVYLWIRGGHHNRVGLNSLESGVGATKE